MIKKIILLFSFLIVVTVFHNVLAQGVKIANTAGPAASSSMLEIESTDRGLLIPRLSLTARNVAAPVTTPANSLLIFNTNSSGTAPFDVSPGFYYWEASLSEWIKVLDGTTIIGDDQNIDSLTITGTLLTTYIENGLPGSVDLLSLATNGNFYNTIRDSLLLDSNFTDSITNEIVNSNTLLDSIYINVSDSLLLDSSWLAALNDSIDDQNIDSLILNGTILTTYIEDGGFASEDLLQLASNSSFLTTVRDSLLADSIFASRVDSILRSDSNFINGLADSLLLDSSWLAALNDSIDDQNIDSLILNGTILTTYIEDGGFASEDLLQLASNSSFLTTVRDSLLVDSIFASRVDSILRSDSNFINGLADSLLLDSSWLAALNDSIDDQDLDSMNLSGTLLTTYIQDGASADQDLLPLASDSSFVSTIATDSNFQSTLVNDSNFTTSLASDSNFISTLVNDSSFISQITSDSSFIDSLLANRTFIDSLYAFTADSLLNDVAFLSQLADSIDSDVDSAVLSGDTINIYENGKVVALDVSGLKDSSEWVDGSLVGLIPGNIYARQSLLSGDTIGINNSNFPTGSFGIGVPLAQAKLHVRGGGIFGGLGALRVQNEANTSVVRFRMNNATLDFEQTFGTFNINRFANTNLQMNGGGGSIAIGKSNNTYPGRLTVHGITADATSKALVVADSSSVLGTNQLFSVRNDGFVTIGSRNPQAKFHMTNDQDGIYDSAFVVTDEGRVGIGNINPSQALDVTGQARIRIINDTNAIDDILVARADGNIQKIDIDTLRERIADSSEWVSGSKVGLFAGNIYAREALRNGDTVVLRSSGFFNGSLGLGAPNPMARLHVKGTSIFEQGNLTIRNADNTSRAEFQLNNRTLELVNGAGGTFLINRFTNHGIAMVGGGGDLSVGAINSPPARLSVRGKTADATGNVFVALDSNTIGDSRLFTIRNDGNVGVGSGFPQARFHVTIDENGVFDSAVVVTDEGRLGIGTINPSHPFDVTGQARIRTINDTNAVDDILVARADGNIQKINIDTLRERIADSSEWIEGSKVGLIAGNIYSRRSLENGDTIVIQNSGFPAGSFGIGVPNPSAQLHVNGIGIFETTSGAHFSVRNKANTSNATFQANNRTLELVGGGRYWINRITSDNLEMMTGGGNLTIGGTPPYPARLSVHGLTQDATANAFMALDSNLAPGAKTALFTIRNDGNVGVGSETPLARFHVTIDQNGVYDSAVVITDQSRMGIGTLTPTERLQVIGNVAADTFFSLANTYPDYVFEDYFDGTSTINEKYKFKSLQEIEDFIKEHKHLPGVIGIDQVKKLDKKYKVDISNTSIKNLEKIEELYLHLIEVNKEKDALKDEVQELRKENESFRKELEEIKELLKNNQ